VAEQLREFAGKTALITGGASGIGFATAQRMAAGGARVILFDVREAATIDAASKLGERHLGVAGDVSSQSDVERCVSRSSEFAGAINILINCAGVPDNHVPTVDQSFEHWNRLLSINLSGTYLMCKTVARYMIAAKRGGAIVNLNSIAGVVGLPVRSAYSASKAGVGMLTRVLGCEWGPAGIRVNAVAPGYILTPMLQLLVDEKKVDSGRIRCRTPMGRLGTADDVASAICFLASDGARFITGATLPVDGGYMAFAAPSDAFDIEDAE
jgi:NAD(P)-dependent dehydrogenase (short-subunit alcohol dehydrogenase family)